MLRLLLGGVLVNGLLVAPSWLPAALEGGPSASWIALEAALVVGLFALLPDRPWSRFLARAAALAVVLLSVVGLLDAVFLVVLGRPLNLSLDLYLIGAVYHLAVGNLGLAATLTRTLAALLGMTLATLALAWLLAPADVEGSGLLHRLALRLGGVALVAVSALVLQGAAEPGAPSLLSAPVVRLARDQSELLRVMRGERSRFQSDLNEVPDSYAELPGLLGKLRDRNVLLTFVESYGMAALEDPEFAAVVHPRLDSMAARLAAAGLHVATGTLVSPTLGGQSWYAHGTVISGLWLDNQLRYDLLMVSDRETLIDDLRRAGHETVALMPAILRAWPEGVRIGYDRVYTRPDIPYAGPPLFWVTMPDQFTLSFLERTLHAAEDHPLFVEAALVSSHAPWTPVLPVLDWDSVGDGAVFAPFRQEGHPPEELWIDTQELRRAYPRSLDYSLQVITGFAERSIDTGSLMVVFGDHQAAPWVTGATSFAVPVHVITGDAELLQPFLDWGFRPGTFPDPAREPARMAEFRDWFVRAFSVPEHAPPPA